MKSSLNILFVLLCTFLAGFGNAKKTSSGETKKLGYVVSFKKGFTNKIYDQTNNAILAKGCVITHRSQIGKDYRMIAFDCPPEMTVLSENKDEPSDFFPQSVNEYAILEKDQEVNIFKP